MLNKEGHMEEEHSDSDADKIIEERKNRVASFFKEREEKAEPEQIIEDKSGELTSDTITIRKDKIAAFITDITPYLS